jgi:hypothetical protein
MKTKRKAKWPIPRISKFKVGDYLILQIKTLDIRASAWVGEVIGVSESTYLIRCLSSDIKAKIRVPFLFEPSLTKIDKTDLNSTIKIIKILYNR